MITMPAASQQLQSLLEASAAEHSHLCPRQVLGVRMGLLAGRLLDIGVPCPDKRLLVIAETDGCVVDGIAASSGCRVGRRTMRIEDYGKVAATFVDVEAGHAVRIVPGRDSRGLAVEYAPEAGNRWEAQLLGYQVMLDELLLDWQWVSLTIPIRDIVSRPDARAICGHCLEEIINEREVIHGNRVLCRACAAGAYYRCCVR